MKGGDPARIRTWDLQLRRLLLYPLSYGAGPSTAEAVPRARLRASASWPSGVPTRNALDVHVLRLRRRIAPVGLEIRTVRSRGYLMQSREVVLQ